MKTDIKNPEQQPVEELLTATATFLRQGRQGWGTEYLDEVIERVQKRLDAASEPVLEKVQPVLVETMQAMERRDYLVVADLIEYRLKDILT
jgi:hypothetical protein